MLLQPKNTQVQLESLLGTKEYEVNKWDEIKGKIAKVKIQITITTENQIIYSLDGVILRKEFFQNDTRNPEILTSMEQIQFLKWQGQYGLNKRKLGKWTATWNGHNIWKVSGYYENGLKQGLWIQPNQLFQIEAQVYESGEYINDQKSGRWNYIYDNKTIGGGQYNEYNQKKGKWIELSEAFQNEKKLTFSFDYKNGKKVGMQDIFWNNVRIEFNNNNKFFCLSGGGQYDDKGTEIKQGNWVEISDNFNFTSQVTYNGQYTNGKKISRWNIWYKDVEMGFEKTNIMIGGGSYDITGTGLKQGNWMEISDNFYCVSQVMYNGEYKNGKKIGRWNIEYKGDQMTTHRGGGSYDEAGDELKQGNWTEISDNFWNLSQVTYNGSYMNGKKIGRWNIEYKGDQMTTHRGGGSYDEAGDELQQGVWMVISDKFYCVSQVMYNGEYKNGTKVGVWYKCRENKRKWRKDSKKQKKSNIIIDIMQQYKIIRKFMDDIFKKLFFPF